MAVSAVKKEAPKGQQAAPAAAAPAPEEQPRKKKGKLLLYAASALLVLSGGGGGAWWYLKRDAAHSTAKAEPEKPPVFAPMDNFTVNLQQEDVSQFAQVGLTLRMSDDAAVAQLKVRMPEIRDRILLMLSAKKPAELLTLEGKRKLADEIKSAVNEILAPEAVKKAAAAAVAAERAAAAARKKPAPAPATPAAPAEGQEGEQPEQTAEAAEAAAEPAAAPAAIVLPVTAVLFTSFIIQ